MYQLLQRSFTLVLLLVTMASQGFSDEPLLALQSASSHRLLATIEGLGLPDPIAAAGIDSASTLELLQNAIDLDSPSGCLVFLSEDRPHLIIALPLIKIQGFLEALPSFGGSNFTRESDGVYRLGEKGSFYASQSGPFLLIGDSRRFLQDASLFVVGQAWDDVRDDILLKANLNRLPAIQKGMLLKETLSLLNSKPAAELLLNFDSLKEHFFAGLQRFLIQSIFESSSFELALNRETNGAMTVRIATVERTSDTQVSSAFLSVEGTKPFLALDFANRLSTKTTMEAIGWARQMEKRISDAIDKISVVDRSDSRTTKLALRFLSNLIQQSVQNERIDGLLTIGNSQDDFYGLGAVAVANGPELAKQLQELLLSLQSYGLAFQDLRTATVRDPSSVDAAINLPADLLSSIGLHSTATPRMHVKLTGGKLFVAIGSEAEHLMGLSQMTSHDAELRPISLVGDMSAGKGLIKSMSNLPIPFSQMRLKVSITDQGRLYECVLNNDKPLDVQSTAAFGAGR